VAGTEIVTRGKDDGRAIFHSGRVAKCAGQSAALCVIVSVLCMKLSTCYACWSDNPDVSIISR